MSRIEPIQTRYAGCRFRSRREARWAVFFDRMGIRWQYEPEGFDLGEHGRYLPDFLLYPGSSLAMWFEVKGQFPSEDDVRKAQALSVGTGLSAYIYFGELALPAPASLEAMTVEEFYSPDEQWHWSNEIGWFEYPSGPSAWEVQFGPTAFYFRPSTEPRSAKRGAFWWTECPYCGYVVLKLHGQVGWCPEFGEEIADSEEPLYPKFAHASERLQAAYVAARSARFEFGEQGG